MDAVDEAAPARDTGDAGRQYTVALTCVIVLFLAGSAASLLILGAEGLIPETLRWTNRPTFQQAIEVGR